MGEDLDFDVKKAYFDDFRVRLMEYRQALYELLTCICSVKKKKLSIATKLKSICKTKAQTYPKISVKCDFAIRCISARQRRDQGLKQIRTVTVFPGFDSEFHASRFGSRVSMLEFWFKFF